MLNRKTRLVRIWAMLVLLVLTVCLVSACQPVDDIDLGVTPLVTEAAIAGTGTVDTNNALAAFTTFLQSAEAARIADRPFLVNNYVTTLPEAPLTAGKQAVFLYRGDANRVQLTGDMNNWSPGETDDFTRLVGSSLWWLAAEYESDARLDYRLIVDGVAQLDPLNPHTILGSDGLHSELKMPDYAAPPELAPTDAVYPAGTISDFIIDSAYLGRTRTYFVYEPAGQLVGAKLPSLYVHDGTDYMNIVDMPAILDRLIAERDIPPLLVVFVPPIDRPNEYDRDDAYTNFIAEELLPAVRNRFDTDPDPARTGTLGSAEGGLAALHLATSRPDLFGLVATQSGMFGLNNGAIITELSLAEALPLKLHLAVGRYETAVGGNSAENDLLELNRRLAAFLREKGYDFEYAELPAGHSWGFWQAQIGDALRFLYD
ncbi:MAG: alpha/beta hydrolase-fold protein [Anaerolineae bacterium]|nr:alpha/beta hydrolase-fold protein [Anaerolineae bacterium]MCO5187668.1 alpha/beta hydrolase-fold protein [Anaerolineae bacterium]